jgi:hypothetical protein
LDDNALSDGGEDALTEEQQGIYRSSLFQDILTQNEPTEQLNNGLEEVRVILGAENQNGMSDVMIKDALWEFYFDVRETVQWLVGML